MRLHTILKFSICCWIFITQCANSTPHGFVKERVASLTATTGAFARNPKNKNQPMLLLASKEGKIWVLEDPDNSSDYSIILNLEEKVCTNGQRGLLSLRPHPLFGLQNYYLYIYYTNHQKGCLEDGIEGPSNRLVRVEMDSQTFKFGPEEVLLETAPLPSRFNNGGSVTFGNDGKLYVTTGDGGQSDSMYSQQKYNLHGKILRLNDDGSIPESNPFMDSTDTNACGKHGGVTSSNQVCAEIFSLGMQNPFHLAMNPNNAQQVEFRVGDIGASNWEEISYGGSAYAGHNYGWPVVEGPCINTSGNCSLLDEFHDPEYYYEHVSQNRGGYIVGSAFVPKGLWPVKYEYLFIDFVFGKIYNLIKDNTNECRLDCQIPIPGYRNETFHQDERMINMFFGPYQSTQALYVLSRSSNSNTNIFRIHYNGDENRSPIARIAVKIRNELVSSSDDVPVGESFVTASVGEALTFDGAESTDEDGDALTYFWELANSSNSWGNTNSSEQTLIEVFPTEGEYVLTLTVTDELSQSDSTSIKIRVGTPPLVTMLSPSEGDEFFVGQEITLRGSGIDSNGSTGLELYWEVRLHRGEHYQPFLVRTRGNDITLLPAPEPEDFLNAAHSYLEVLLTAVDKDGLSSPMISRIINPILVNVAIDSIPQGLEVMVDGFPIVTPQTIVSWQNHELHVIAYDQMPFEFEAWSNGNEQKHSIVLSPQDGNNAHSLIVFFHEKVEEILLVPEVRSCSPDAPCGRCEGHCRSNADCRENLRCYFKGGRGFPVPGCIGIDNSRTDWCTLPESTPRATLPPTSSPTPQPTIQPSSPSCKIPGLSCHTNSDCCSLFCFSKAGTVEKVCLNDDPIEKVDHKLSSGRGGRGNTP